MADYKQVCDVERAERNRPEEIDPRVVNKLVSNVFLLVTLQTSVYYAGIRYLMNCSRSILKQIRQDYYHVALVVFIVTSFLFVYTRKYHRKFPGNIAFILLPISGLGVIFWVQLVRFGLEKASRSDVPALLFLVVSSALISMASRNAFFPYMSWWKSYAIFFLLVLLVAVGIVFSFQMQEDFRYLSLIVMAMILLYLIVRVRVLVLSKGFNNVASESVHVYLELLVLPLAVSSGPITFAYFYILPYRYE